MKNSYIYNTFFKYLIDICIITLFIKKIVKKIIINFKPRLLNLISLTLLNKSKNNI